MSGGPVRVATVITRLEGGAGQHALRGALGLDPARYEMTIITGSGDPRLLDQAARGGLEVLIEPALRTPIAPRSDLRALAGCGNCSPAGASTSCTRTRPRPGWSGASPPTAPGCPGWCTPTTGSPSTSSRRAPRRHAYVQIERGLGRITDLALCVGTGVAVEAVRRRLISPERIRTIGVVADGPAPPHDAPPGAAGRLRCAQRPARARAALGLPADATVVGAVGRLTYQKAPEDFLAALQALDRPGVTGVWVGDGELAGQVAARARETPGVRVVLAGQRGNVPDLLPAFDVFALPSRYEGLPTAVVEAMVCGIPVVATAVNAVGDVVVPGETGLLVPPGRPGADGGRRPVSPGFARGRGADGRGGAGPARPAVRRAGPAPGPHLGVRRGCRSLATRG